MRYACNRKFKAIELIVILWPDADIVTFVLDAEVTDFFDWCIFVVVGTDDYTDVRCFGWLNTAI